MLHFRAAFRLRSRYLVVGAVLVTAGLGGLWFAARFDQGPQLRARHLKYKPRQPLETSGIISLLFQKQAYWGPNASLEEIAEVWRHAGHRHLEQLDRYLAGGNLSAGAQIIGSLLKAGLLLYEGEARTAFQVLEQARARAEADPALAATYLFTIVYLQGVTALRIGENDNCILCRGESSCILPISPAAVHTNPKGSRLAVQHFTEYLRQFPDDLEVRWLLNLAHMTLGEYPDKIAPQFLVPLDHWRNCAFDIGKFRDVGHLVGVNRFNMAGGAIMDDFDNDGLLDLVTTSWDATLPMAYYRNRGDGTFEERAAAAGLAGQLGGLYCVQTDYNNDGLLDVFVCRGAWVAAPIRPSLLRNNGDGTFTDVTREAGLLDPANSICAAWADYDNDGFLDLFLCCERQPNRLYRNKGDGTFEEVGARVGVQGGGHCCKGAAWIDFDNDGYPDLFLTNFDHAAQLFRNNRDGTFTEVTTAMGINGPVAVGFSCWAWDYDNDGWLDLFATCYEGSIADVVKGLLGQPHDRQTGRLFRNLGGKGFRDVTREAGLDMVFLTMGSNFGDFDNDGYLDFYLGTGNPDLAALRPNRMFKNVAGKRFAEITAAAGTGHLQKGHSVACGDWNRDGSIDVFIEMGGAIPGDKYHNVLFQNPGQGNNWLTVKLVGKRTNRAAIGARIKAVTSGESPLTVCRHVSSGSSFGANPLQQHIGVGRADRVALLEVHWPTSGTTQVFRDVAVNQAIEVTEFATEYRRLNWTPIPLPK
jgi:hypothetical protein